jgi:hypothetical protein
MDKVKLAAAFNEWMRRYTEDPAGFASEFQSVGLYLAERAMGKEPTYGETCTEYLIQLMEEAA